jgi:hypothetical protein
VKKASPAAQFESSHAGYDSKGFSGDVEFSFEIG